MKRWQKVLSGSLMVALAATATAACSGSKDGGSSGKKVTLTLLSHYNGTNEAALKPYIDKWNSENPNIQVKMTPVDFGELLKTIMTKQSAGQVADIMHVYTLWGGQLAKNNVLAEAPQSVADDVAQNYPEAAVKGASLNGKVFGYPTEVQAYGLFYNKKLLKEAGYDAPPKTWDELLEMSKKIEKKDSSGKVLVQGFGFQRGYAGLVDQPFMAMMAAAGSGLLSDDLSKSNLDSDAGRKTMDFYSKVYGKNGITDIAFNTTKGFGAGQVGMTIGAGWWDGSLKTLMKDAYADVGEAPMPTPDGGAGGTMAYTWAYGVNSKSKHQEEAWKFLQWMNAQADDSGMTPEGQFLLDTFNVIPSRKTDLSSAKVQEKLQSNPSAKLFADALNNALDEQSPAAGTEVQDILYKQIESMWTDQIQADAALNNAHTQINAKLGEK
ncbi:ABC transporter substrate-binding protein [Cohnella nanjingensis]|uniref:ABC transporter substrate-binding protein n=1 Tax=Cohnella nanjingensis TaxID=1387779 RepID=A0A7X0VFS7_9BACL|nr:ABC transporter substrate-binding protein [Cohnella nanjingensis]MBB6672131.1 ABC transporter substrate-binding protein [Cohnella nanjingensis]